MVAFFRQSLTRQLPLAGAVGTGVLVALVLASMPGAWLEGLVSGSGLSALLPTAEPPLGVLARVAVAIGAGVIAGAIGWAVLYLLFGTGGVFAAPRVRAADGAPSVRRADAHPDAPPRRPLSAAAELAAPPSPVVVEQPLPADLDTPLAAFDPAAIPPVPREPVRPVAPLAPGERIETFALARPTRPDLQAEEPPSIDALLRRLEQGAERRVAAAR